MTSPTFDNGIPELTEVIVADVIPAVVSPSAANETATLPPIVTHAAAIPAALPFGTQKTADSALPPSELSDWTDAEWRRMETEIRERIAHQVMGRIDFVLEQRVRDSLADVLQTAVEGLANEIKLGLRVTLEDVIGRAVTQEITRLKTTKK